MNGTGDLQISLKLTTTGGKIVVQEMNAMTDSTRRATGELNQTSAAGTKAGAGLKKAGEGATRYKNSSAAASAETNKLRNNLIKLAGGAALVYAGMRVFNKIKGVAVIADDFNVLQQRVKTATKDTGDYADVWDELYSNAQDNGAVMQGTVELFQRLSMGRKELEATNKMMLDFTDTVQKTGVIGGSTNEAMKHGLTQLSQSMSSNIVRAEEFNSVLENIPFLAVQIGEGMGNIDKGELRQMVLDGKLLSKDVFDAILKQMPDIAAEFDALPLTMGRAGTQFDNAVASALSRMDQVTGVTLSWAGVLHDAADVIDSFTADEMAVSLKAAADTGKLLAVVVGTGLVIAYGKNAVALMLAVRNQLLYNATAGASVGVMGNVARAATAQQIVMRGLGVATTFALGPIGLMIIAAGVAVTAFSYFSSKAEEARTKSAELGTELRDTAAGFDTLTDAAIKNAISGNDTKIDKARQRIDDLRESLAGAKSTWDAASKSGSTFATHMGSGALDTYIRDTKRIEAALGEAVTAHIALRKENSALESQLKDNADNRKTDEVKTATESLTKATLSLYNAQKLSAEALDDQGRALNGIDLAIFKSQFIEATKLPEDAAVAIKAFSEISEAAANTLKLDTYIKDLVEQSRLLDLRLGLSKEEFAVQQELAKFAGANTESLFVLEQEIELMVQKQATADAQGTLESIQQENALLGIRLEQGKEEYEIQKALFALKGGDPAVLAAIEQELQAQQLLNEQIKISEEIAKDAFGGIGGELSDLQASVDDIGMSLARAFGDAAKQITAMSTAQNNYNKDLAKLQKEKSKIEKMDKGSDKRAKLLLENQKNESKLSREHFQNQMGQMSALAGAASEMFGEQSKERENLHKLEMAFGAVEMAMALQKAAVNAINAITNQGSGDPYTAFARMAAMAAVMAGLGVFDGSVSGGGVSSAERQETQGTGSVLGDSSAKSNSIENTFERIESLELDQYNELRSINDSIQALSRGIASLAVSLAQSYGRFDEQAYGGDLGAISNTDTGGHFENVGTQANFGMGDPLGGVIDTLIGGISKTTRDLIDSGISFDAQSIGDLIANGTMDATYYSVIETTERKMWGLTKDISQNTEYSAIDSALNASFSQVFTHIGSSITGAVNVLGVQTASDLADFVIDLPHISFKDLTGDEIEAELNAVLSSQSDAMAQFVLPGISQFQKMGEGLYDTLLRVSQEQAIFNAQMDALGLSLKDVSNVSAEAQVEITQSIIQLMGGIEAYRNATGEYFNEFYTDAEKFNFLSGTLNTAFSDLGLSVPATRNEFRALVGGIDQTTKAGQELFATLMELVPSMAEYQDKLAEQNEFAREHEIELARLDMTPLQQSINDLEAWYQEQIDTAEELGAETVFLERLYARKRTDAIEDALADLNASHEKSVQALNAEYDKLFGSMDKVGSGIANAILNIQRQASGWNETGYQDSIVGNLYEQVGVGSTADQVGVIGELQAAINARYKAELAGNKELQQANKQRYQVEKAAVDAMRSAAKQLLNAADALLLSADSPALLGTQLGDAKSQFSTLLAAAQGGDASSAQQLQGVGSSYLGIAKDFYAQGSTEYAEIFAEIQAAYRGVGGSTIVDPPVPVITRNYQVRDAALQQRTIDELSNLQLLLDDLRIQEQAELELAHAELAEKNAADAAAMLAIQQEQINAINNSAQQVVNELRNQGNNVATQNAALVAEVRRLRTANTRTQEMIFSFRRQG